MAFAENLNHLMEMNEITNYFIAKELGVSQTSVANWRNGSNHPHKKTRIAIAALFGLSLDEIDGDNKINAVLVKKENPTENPGGAKEQLLNYVEQTDDMDTLLAVLDAVNKKLQARK